MTDEFAGRWFDAAAQMMYDQGIIGEDIDVKEPYRFYTGEVVINAEKYSFEQCYWFIRGLNRKQRRELERVAESPIQTAPGSRAMH